MSYFQNKKLYNVIVNTGNVRNGNKGYITYHNVGSIEKFERFCSGKFPDWQFANVYDKSEKINGKPKFILTIKPNKSSKPKNNNNLTFDF